MLMLWNKDKTHSVRASKIQVLRISSYEDCCLHKTTWLARGWFNDNDYFTFGDFDTEEQAREFVESLHLQMLTEDN